ncbi:MAG: precorrin-8X methylmutase, partial [Thermoproteota archaeon]
KEMNGSGVVVGNAPPAVFDVISMIKERVARPALVIGVPVGFVSSPESKDALQTIDVPYITNKGRKGGSPCASAIVNALFNLIREELSS